MSKRVEAIKMRFMGICALKNGEILAGKEMLKD
jgi:hypothetical protein